MCSLDRKVLCDGTLPHCNRCVKANRRCEGYGTRLSWPRRDDPRRAIIGPAPAKRRGTATKSGLRLVNASSWDIELLQLVPTSADVYGTLLQGLEATYAAPSHNHLPIAISKTSLPLLRTPITWVDLQLSPIEKDLFEYCQFMLSLSVRCLRLTSRSRA